jgi:putative acetyltransferase
MDIRTETPADHDAITRLITTAFATAAHASGTEAAIVERLRARGQLTISLVAETASEVIGHVAFSPVAISDETPGWYGLGPVAVLPDHQGSGVGRRLIEHGLDALRALGAEGCVLLGDPAYYGRFGFSSGPDLVYPGPPAEYFQSLALREGAKPAGVVAYDEAFDG